MSIATLDDDERRILEPQSSPIIERLQSLHEYAQVGVKTSVFFGPVYPTIKPENLPDIIKTFSEYGAQEVMIDKLNIKPGIEQSIQNRLIEHKWRDPSFLKHNLSNEKRYQQIRNITKKIGKQEGIRIIDAF
jgi:DNA repair photolyase